MEIRFLDCLSPADCESIKQRVHALKEHWVARIDEKIPFYTLGAASYLDAEGKKEARYRGVAQRINPILKAHFQDLYDRLVQVISGATGLKTDFDETLGLPGFHIFLYSELFTQPLASKHFDLQFELIDWKGYHTVDFAHPISYTLAIALPKSGGGMYCWNIYYDTETASKKIEGEEIKKLIKYQEGKLVLHEGLMLHQIAPIEDSDPSDARITLQGHGLICDGVLRLYW